jgi:hypothetical protein
VEPETIASIESEGETKGEKEALLGNPGFEILVDVGRSRGIEGIGHGRWKGSSDMETGWRPPL